MDGPLTDFTRDGRVARPLVLLQDEGGVDLAARAVRLHGVGETADRVRVPTGALDEELPALVQNDVRVLLRELHHGTAHGAVFVGGEALAEDVVLPEELFAVQVVFGADRLDRDHLVNGGEGIFVRFRVCCAHKDRRRPHEGHDLVTVVPDEPALEPVDADEAYDDEDHGDDFLEFRQDVLSGAEEQQKDEGDVHERLGPPQTGDDREEREEEGVLPTPLALVLPGAQQHDEHGELDVDVHAEAVPGELVREHRRQQEGKDLDERVDGPQRDLRQPERALEFRDDERHADGDEDVL